MKETSKTDFSMEKDLLYSLMDPTITDNSPSTNSTEKEPMPISTELYTPENS